MASGANRPERRIIELRTTSQNYNDAVTDIEQTSILCKEFSTQPPAEQRRLLKIIIEKATWKNAELETTLRNPFEKLRGIEPRNPHKTKEEWIGWGGNEELAPQVGFEPTTLRLTADPVVAASQYLTREKSIYRVNWGTLGELSVVLAIRPWGW